ncbi:MAG TPA: hypothetical protein VNU94_08275 [Acidobacteriaceae bacterium]|nr:hypothetical protein [Acidobacteriaceae bacterium]
MTAFFKDKSLDRLAAYGNVAQFASFDPSLTPRYSRILDRSPNEGLDLKIAVSALLAASPERRINVRSFTPENHQGNEFIYGLSDVKSVIENVRRLAGLGFYVILNETVDVNDGGVSGVSQGSIIEFAPHGTPRVVDTARPVSLRLSTGLSILESVYGFSPDISFPPRFRVEFSIHPIRRGWRQSHTILWELEETAIEQLPPNPRWPNDFSEFLGDKLFGLLIAHGEGYDVPRTKVLSRHLEPFIFGCPTNSDICWVRTSPRVAAPGRFTTVRGWTDPFKLLMIEDPKGEAIPAVLIQDEVPAKYSGALLTDVNKEPIIEGVPGYGDALMLGSVGPSNLPEDLKIKLRNLHDCIQRDFGSIRIEWVFDGDRIWIVQLQQESSQSSGAVIVDGDFSSEITFRTDAGLEELRHITNQSLGTGVAIRLIGNIGITSHMADILRRAGIPSRLVRE